SATPGSERYTGTGTMSPSSTAVAPTYTLLPLNSSGAMRPSRTSLYEKNVNEAGEMEKSIGKSPGSVTVLLPMTTTEGKVSSPTRHELRTMRTSPSEPGCRFTEASDAWLAKRSSGRVSTSCESAPDAGCRNAGRTTGACGQ